MADDEDDATVVTAELRHDHDVFAGRADPVVLSDWELALVGEADDGTDRGRWLPADGAGDSDRPKGSGRGRLRSFVARGAAATVLAVPAMLIVAFGIAIAAR